MDLYREELMDIVKNPVNRGNMDDPSVDVSKKNPLCGDEIHLQLKFENGLVKEAKFDGTACAVSVIASEMLTDLVIGKSVEELKAISKETFLEKIGLNLSTSRVKCATLVLDALQGALEIYDTDE